MPGELSVAREALAGAALAIELGCAAVVAYLVARRVSAGDRLLGSVLGALAVLAQGAGVPLVLGAMGLLRLPAVLVVHLLAAAAALAWDRRRAGAGVPPMGVAEPRSWARRPLVLAAVAASAAYVLLATDLSIGLPSADNDTREYHVTNLAHWLREGSIWDLPFQSGGGVTATHPGDGELFALWLALPSGGDELSYAMPVAFAALALLAGALLARELRGDPDPGDAAAVGALGVVAVLAAPIFFSSQVASLSTDLVAGSAVLAALALLVVARRAPSPGLVAAAGVAIGLAVGSKYTALVPGAAVTLSAVALVRERRLWWWLVPGVVVLAAPWYLRNLLATGNPLFPLALGPLPGGDVPLDVIDTTMAEHLAAGRDAVLRRWLDLGSRLVGPVALLVGAAAALVLRHGPQRRERAVVVAVMVASFAGYIAIPYSGGGPDGLAFLIASSLRYALTALLLGVVLVGATVPARVAGVLVALVLAWDLWRLRVELELPRTDLTWSDQRALVAVVAGGAMAASIRWAVTSPRPGALATRRSVAAVAVAAVVVVGGAGAALFHRQDRGRTLTGVEQAILAFGEEEPVIVLGTGDLRSLLGPRLARPLIGVSRGGEADEIPFADRDQVRRHFLDDTVTAPPPRELSEALDVALAAARPDLLVVGTEALATYPDGWVPDASWCVLRVFDRIAVYARNGSPLAPTGGCGAGQ